MNALEHHPIHMPHAVPTAVHWLERVAGAIFFTILAPAAIAIFVLTAFVLALGLTNLF